ncbi:MAG TPA: sugar ABC transporter ATP-binding protein [Baekduia sp.]|nr:sugar ABC transporter ATP-binding protein [Baekduia sp.]
MADLAKTPHVELIDVSRNFGGVQAVRGVSLAIERGTIHGLVGENGAGKSTLSKVVAGAISPSSGQLRVDGEDVSFSSPRDALNHGIAIIDQELALVPARSVLDNVFLGSESGQGGLLQLSEQRKRFDAVMERTGFDLDPDRKVGSLRIADQQKVEIIRAVARDAAFIIMDEPTARLTQVESEQLYEIINGLKARGTTILYISHFLEEVLQLADNVTVMRDGLHIRTGPAANESSQTLVTAMLGRDLELRFPDRKLSDPDADPVLEVRGLSGVSGFEDVDLTLRPGEIVGMAGLIGAGRSEFARGLFGAERTTAGEILIDGEPVKIRSPRQAFAHGLAMVTESRKDDGLIMTRSIAENSMMPFLSEVSTMGVLRHGSEKARVIDMIEQLDIRTSGPQQVVRNLSGGNQQKVLFAKSLMRTPKVLIIDEPTRGVDVGAKQGIYELITELAASGMAILVISSELEEVMGLAHRILVMRRGRLVADMNIDVATEENILAAAFGTAGTVAA